MWARCMTVGRGSWDDRAQSSITRVGEAKNGDAAAVECCSGWLVLFLAMAVRADEQKQTRLQSRQARVIKGGQK